MMSTPLATWLSACLAAPASAATLMPCSWHFSITSTGGEPSALAISTGRCWSATSRCERATECSQPSTPSRPSPSGSGGTPSLSSVSSTNFLCSSGIIAPRSTEVPSVGIFIGITMSTPYGLPSVLSSSQVRTRSSSSVSLNRTQPRTPSPPARDTAAATCSDGVNAKIG